MNDIRSSMNVVCPFCDGTSFSSETKGVIFKTIRFVCLKCGSIMETKDNTTFSVVTIGDAYSNTEPFMQGRKLTHEQLIEPDLPILADADLISISNGEGDMFERIIYEADQKVPIILKQEERAIFCLQNITLSEERSQRKSSGFGSFSFRVTKGVWFHTGRLSQPEYANAIQILDTGNLILTTKRYVFIGANKSVEQSLSKVTAIKPFIDGLGIVRSNKQKVEYYQGGCHWPLIGSIFMGVVKNYA